MSINSNFFPLAQAKTLALSLILSLSLFYSLTPRPKTLSALPSKYIENMTISPHLNCCHLVQVPIISCLDI